MATNGLCTTTITVAILKLDGMEVRIPTVVTVFHEGGPEVLDVCGECNSAVEHKPWCTKHPDHILIDQELKSIGC